MANNYFKFKQFTIYQDGSAMKVGTDGVLLGAWADIQNAKRVLDIGTGSGVIALMLAQRNQDCNIDAIEINKSAYEQAVSNINISPWSDKVEAIHNSLQQFEPTYKYDSIVSNPPYFIESTKAGSTNRTIARHTYTLHFSDIILFTKKHLQKDGVLSIILPVIEGDLFIKEAEESKLFCIERVEVIPKPNYQPKRLLLRFSNIKRPLQISPLTIETEIRHHYTDQYISLTKDFYLNF